MKRHIRPICIALSMILTTSLLTVAASADFESSVLNVTNGSEREIDTSTGFPEAYKDSLFETAKKFGSETDYFIFKNFSYLSATAEMSNPCYRSFISNVTNAEIFAEPAYNSPEYGFTAILHSGHCYGISVLEILNHNGYIVPSDLQDGAKKLTDVTRDSAKDIVSHYQTSQYYTLFDTYFRWNFRTYSDEERVQQLLSTAEKASNEGKYFLIIEDAKSENLNSVEHFSHAVAGIGITDGNWEFNGEYYDKCILTFDSNAVRKDSFPDVVAWGFLPECSIFINSQTYQAYIPGYGFDENSEINFFSLDDETLMNHLGIINPSESVNTDISGINKIAVLNDGDYSINVADLNGEIYDGINSSYKKAQEALSKIYYCRGKEFTVSNSGTDLNVNFSDINRTFKVKTTENAENIIADDNNLTVTTNGSAAKYDVTLIQNNPDLPYFFYRFVGETKSDIKITKTEDGIVLSGDDGVQCLYDFMKPEYDSYGILINDYDSKNYSNAIGVTASESVMLRYDSNLGAFAPYLDMDKDGSYESEAEKGDVNCDGKIDISDASSILACYAAKAVGNTSYANMFLSDYNADGSVDITDASEVLFLYASNAIKNTNN